MLLLLSLLHQQAVIADEEVSEGIDVAVITNAEGAHLGAYFSGLAHAPEARTVVLADPDGKVEAEARKALGDKLVGVYTDRAAMLAEVKPAMVVISLEARLAPEAIDAALEAGCHVLAEKPACVRAEDFAPLVEKAESKNLHLMLALSNRSNPEVLKARELIAEGAIGKVYGLEARFVKDQRRLTSPSFRETWFVDKARAGGGNLSWLGIHWLDLAMFVSGSPITHVTGFAGNVGGQPIDTEDSAAVSMRFENGTFGTMTSAYFLDSGSETFLRIWGEKGWLQIGHETPGQVRWYSTLGEKPEEQVYTGPAHSSYGAYVRTCVRASAGLETPPITGRECLRVLKVIYGLYEASETGRTVAVE